MTDEHFMRLAIEKARDGMRLGQTPFGATIVRAGEVIATAHNIVWATTDPTAHAEVTAIREACTSLNAIDLTGCTIYSTCEPCPMCFAACHWARISRIVYGAAIADAKAAGFNELTVSNDQLKQFGKSPIQITGGFMRNEALELFEAFKVFSENRKY
jgi:tRNA(Arg) A34 adenosine deaminase TadA